MLREEMLDSLEAGWRRHGAPIADSLRLGLAQPDVEAMTAELDLRLPVEARTWWGWHDGASTMFPTHTIGAHYVFPPLEAAIGQYRRWRDIARKTVAGEADLDAEDLWAHSWFPILLGGDGTTVACDCSVDEAEPSPIHVVNWKVFMNPAVPAADSLGTVVSWWIEALEDGTWRFDRQRKF